MLLEEYEKYFDFKKSYTEGYYAALNEIQQEEDEYLIEMLLDEGYDYDEIIYLINENVFDKVKAGISLHFAKNDLPDKKHKAMKDALGKALASERKGGINKDPTGEKKAKDKKAIAKLDYLTRSGKKADIITKAKANAALKRSSERKKADAANTHYNRIAVS